LRTPISGAPFRRDVKLAQKRGKDMAKLREMILLLIEGKPLPARYKDHPLGGEWSHHRDCHIEPDWLLIYKLEGDDCTWSAPGRTPICSERNRSERNRSERNRSERNRVQPTCNHATKMRRYYVDDGVRRALKTQPLCTCRTCLGPPFSSSIPASPL